ncbi:Mbeg1-like protein [Streptococcus caprae]|uniref:Mbeg1-like protein n=1 Tax=Streptococcus caprae TaxID=1640501 RepID=A0ABV8CVH3_9STRE
MATLLDYVIKIGRQSFEETELTELDIAVLNELGYLPVGELLSEIDGTKDSRATYSVIELLPLYQRIKDEIQVTFLVTRERLELLDAVLASPRYQDLHFGNYINDISTEFEKQFAAIVMSFPSQEHTQVVFRGTDDTLIGWKEDLNMTYMSEIPAQRSAKRYLAQILESVEGPIIVSGHSKGGNLALFASSSILESLQNKVSEIYLFDSPGLHPWYLETYGYRQIRHKLRVYRPYESVVGVMLALDIEPRIVASAEKGFAQHIMMSWEVEDHDFVRLEEESAFSQALQQTFSDWMASYSKQELKIMVDSFFSIFMDAGLNSLDDFTMLSQGSLNRLISQFSSVEPAKRNLMLKSLSKMVDLYVKHNRELKKNQAAKLAQNHYQTHFLDRILDGILKRKMVSPSETSSTND